MTLNIRNKRSAVQGSAPTASQLQDGELAVNYNASDPVIYTKDTAGNVIRLTGAGADGNFRRVGTTLSPTTPGDVVNVGAGTAAAPSLHFSDANSGLYRPGTNQVAIATGGTQRVLFDSNGNVGIGRTPGAFKLDVNGTTRILSSGQSSLLEIGRGTTSNQYAYIDLVGDTTYADYGLRVIRNNTGANTTSELRHRGAASLNFITEQSAPLVFSVNNLERMRVHTNGNLGIGTTNPARSVHIADAQPIIRLEDSDGTNQYGEVFKAGSGLYLDSRNNTGNGQIVFRGNGGNNEYARFDANGNFGIGTTNPGRTIHIKNTLPDLRLEDTDSGTANTYGDIIYSISSIYLDSRNGTSNGSIIFRGRGGNAISEYARFDANGDFGLGTTSPAQNIHIESTFPALRLEDSNSGTADTYGEVLFSTNAMYLDSRNGTSNAPIVFRGYNGTAFTEYGRFKSSGEFLAGGSIQTGNAPLGFNGANYGTQYQIAQSNGSGAANAWVDRSERDAGVSLVSSPAANFKNIAFDADALSWATKIDVYFSDVSCDNNSGNLIIKPLNQTINYFASGSLVGFVMGVVYNSGVTPPDSFIPKKWTAADGIQLDWGQAASTRYGRVTFVRSTSTKWMVDFQASLSVNPATGAYQSTWNGNGIQTQPSSGTGQLGGVQFVFDAGNIDLGTACVHYS